MGRRHSLAGAEPRPRAAGASTLALTFAAAAAGLAAPVGEDGDSTAIRQVPAIRFLACRAGDLRAAQLP